MKKPSRRKAGSTRARRTRFYQREAALQQTSLAIEAFRSGRLDDAERDARKALRTEPGSYDASLLLGSILVYTRREREAVAVLREALRRKPKDALLLFNMAGCALYLGRLDEARRAVLKFLTVLDQDPLALRGKRPSYRARARKLLRAIEERASGDGAGARPAAAGSAGEQTRPPDTGHVSRRADPRQLPLIDLPPPNAVAPSVTAAGPAGATHDTQPISPDAMTSAHAPNLQRRVPEPEAKTGVRPSAPASPAPPTPADPRLAVRIEIGAPERSLAPGLPWVEDPWSDDLAERELFLEAHQIRLLAHYDDLLCLPTLAGVRQLDYQVETVRKVLRRLNGRALLCDEVGLGKTIEASMVIKEYLLRGLARSVLVLVPAGLVRQWREEMDQKFGLGFTPWEEQQEAPQRTAGPLLVIGSIALARHQRNAEAISGIEWDLVVVDEAHHLRRRSTRSWALVNALRKRFLLLLTATPVHNNPMELFELVTLVRPGLLGTPAQFRRRFPDRKGKRWSDPGALRQVLAEVMIRNTRSHAGIALPRRFATTLVLEPLAEEAAAYRAASEYASLLYPGAGPSMRMGLRHLLACAGSGPQAVGEAAARRLAGTGADEAGERPSASEPHPAGHLLQKIVEAAGAVQGSAKTRRLLEMTLSTDEQMVVFCRYRATLAGLSAKLTAAGVEHSVYHGGLSRSDKEAAIEVFRSGARVLLSTESGGEGRNIQFCRTIVNYDLPWDPMQIEQRVGRVHRIGQQRDVFVFNLVLAGTLEEELLRLLEEKIHLFELIVGEVDSILGHLERREEFADILLGLWAGSGDEAVRRRRFEQFGKELAAARGAYEQEKSIEESLFRDDLEA